ncbi:hypothetical protein [Tsuneonella sp. HG222]
MAQAAGEDSAVVAPACDRACLLGALGQHMAALRAKDPTRMPLAKGVRIAENNVLLAPGQGLWRTLTDLDATGLEAADPLTGNAAWFGSARENGQPVILAVRIHVNAARQIDEIESVVHRKTALPAPFGDVTKMVHDPEFNQILPPEQRRPRERMMSIADGYFSTTELNDGQIFTDFAKDCSRLENGISTTAPTPGSTGGNAAAIASGCREQFLLGIYKINKRIRRDFFIFDEERGVAVGRGFFDHANEWDRYLLTNGREMKTALKWPNTITLLEAFRIKDAEIQRIEAVFTYVPYFMHNPFWGPDSAPPVYKPQPRFCDAACLTAQARSVMAGYVGNNWRTVNWAPKVGYAENSVGIRVGEGIWAGVSAIDSAPLIVADPQTGKSVWIGRIEEHGQPAWAAVTTSSAGQAVGGVDALIRRKEYGPPWADPQTGGAPQFAELPAKQRTKRAAMIKGAEQWYTAINTRKGTPRVFDPSCKLALNGMTLAGCSDAFVNLPPIERIRDRQVLAVDEARGLVVYRTFEDFPSVGTGYPRTDQVVEVFSFAGGKMTGVHAWTSELPYGMKPHGSGD